MEEHLEHQSFKDVTWLQTFSLNEQSVMDYFSMSQFYDRTCNNEVLKMQSRFNQNQNILDRLHSMTGIEFVISKSDPPSFFLIYKCNRKSSENVEIIDIYYIIDGTIFMAPRLADVVLFRAASARYHLNSALSYLLDWTEYKPERGSFFIKKEDSIDSQPLKQSEILNFMNFDNWLLRNMK